MVSFNTVSLLTILGTPPEEYQMDPDETTFDSIQNDPAQLDKTSLEIQNEASILEEQFHSIVRSAFSAIAAQNISVDMFIAGLANLSLERKALHKDFLEKLCSDISKESTLGKVWFKLSTYWNFLNYFLLEQVVCEFGDRNIKDSMEDYKSKLKVFRCNTCLHDFAKYSTKISADLTVEDFHLLSMKLKKNWEKCTLEDLENLTGKFTHKLFVSSFSLTLKEIKPGCIHVTWTIPGVIGESLKENMENTDMWEFCKEHGITSITVNGEECKYLAAVKGYTTFLRYFYSKKGGRDLIRFKLARIEGKKVDRRKCDKFTRSTLRGDQDDVVYTKQHMDENEIGIPGYWDKNKQPRFVLIEGAPGVGKTTFSEQFCYKWSQDHGHPKRQHSLANHRLLVLLPLRDNRVRSARNVSDLFQHPQLQQAIAEEVESSGGEGVALWLEAWDELGEEMRNKSSIFLDLVHGRVLPKATVIITSRPWATRNLRENTNIKLDQHIEIVSTPNIQFIRVKEDQVKPEIRAKFIDYVNDNPSIKATMHTPVTADIVAEVFQWSRYTESNPPTTMTQLYTAFTCKLLMQHLSSHKEEGSKSGKIRSLEEVPADMKGRLLETCRLAWEGIVEQQLTFCSDVVGGDTLGLMHGVRELYGGEDGQLSYHFIHLTLQEFLSAYHITQLPLDKQEQVIREHVRKGHLNRVVRFYFGLTKPNHFTTRMISEHLSDGATAYHWLFEAGDVETFTEEFGSERAVLVESFYSWSPLDYYVVGHSVAHYQFQWELDCSNASMGDEGMEMLSRGMASRNTLEGAVPSLREQCMSVIMSALLKWKSLKPHQLQMRLPGYVTARDKRCIVNNFKALLVRCELVFRDCSISVTGIDWFTKNPVELAIRISKLDFAENELDRNALNVFSQFIPKLSKLQVLSLEHNPIGKGGAVEVLKCLHDCKTPLKELNFIHTGVGEKDCAQLALLIKSTNILEKVDIGDNSLSSNSVASIMKGLLNASTIQQLDMGGSTFSEENCISLASLLQQAECQLGKLDIQECNISGEGAVHLAAALTNNHSLTWLIISDNPIGDIGAAAFGSKMRNNTALKTLYMNRCQITSEGCVQLAEGLIENTALLKLMIGGNHFGVEGAKALSKVVDMNKTLKELRLYSDDSLGEGVDSLLASLQNNKTLDWLRLPQQYQPPTDPTDLRMRWR